jgi:uncharacterized protein
MKIFKDFKKIIKLINHKLSVIPIFFIAIYQRTISPDHGLLSGGKTIPSCKFYPTCSEYSKQSFQYHGFLKGFLLTLKRILRCVPWREYSVDLVPEINNNKK